MSYVLKSSVGVELEEWTLEEYGSLRRELDSELGREGLPLPPDNIFLFHGDSMDKAVHQAIFETTGMKIEDFDLFYTYLTMLDEFAEMISGQAKKGSVFMVYGLAEVLPKYKGLRILEHLSPLKNTIALYRKE